MSRPQRVAIMGMHYAPETTGNAPYTAGLAEGLRRRGLGVRVLTAHPHYPENAFRPGRASWRSAERVEGVPVVRLRHWLPRRLSNVTRLLSEVSFGLRLATSRWGSPDVLLLVSPALFSTVLALLASRLRHPRTPVVVWVQDLYSLGLAETGGGGLVERGLAAVEAATLRSADRLVVIHSRFERSVTERMGVDPSKVSVVRNWSHVEEPSGVDVRSVRRRFGWADDEVVVLHSGNMGLKQGLENVVEAARIADATGDPVRFVLVGDGNQRSRLLELGRGVRSLSFVDPLPADDFSSALAAADILLVNERAGVSEMSVPSKLTSYFAAGRPVLAATDPLGVTADEIRASGGGMVVPSGDPELLLAGALELSRDPERCGRLAENGREYRRSVLSADAAIDQYAGIIALLPRARSGREGNAASTKRGSA
jgi:glycosyltransferase involved in cell wall biosynthesis